MAVSISLAQFNRIATGKYNAGFVDFQTDDQGSLTGEEQPGDKRCPGYMRLMRSPEFGGFNKVASSVFKENGDYTNKVIARLNGVADPLVEAEKLVNTLLRHADVEHNDQGRANSQKALDALAKFRTDLAAAGGDAERKAAAIRAHLVPILYHDLNVVPGDSNRQISSAYETRVARDPVIMPTLHMLAENSGAMLDEAEAAISSVTRLENAPGISSFSGKLEEMDGTARGGRKTMIYDLVRPTTPNLTENEKPALADENVKFVFNFPAGSSPPRPTRRSTPSASFRPVPRAPTSTAPSRSCATASWRPWTRAAPSGRRAGRTRSRHAATSSPR
ncbi:MAG: hypothetical protein J6V72_19510 [Kiritimatiellae bacterium]|nr:hypothetical protein [Kiritimatiellia bacterium]